jgi:hypothetical protein
VDHQIQNLLDFGLEDMGLFTHGNETLL